MSFSPFVATSAEKTANLSCCSVLRKKQVDTAICADHNLRSRVLWNIASAHLFLH
tara:strand:- start:201 stop:365 length:165 start_codon:yes stop_codon:yes gene_type:complete